MGIRTLFSPANTLPVRKKSGRGDATRISAWRWQPGQKGDPSGRPKHDLAAEIAKACIENNADALYKAFSKALLKGNAYAFRELSDRAYGRLKRNRDMSNEDIEARIKELERELGVTPALPARRRPSSPKNS